MDIGGFQNFSLNEFPGRVSAVVFCRGCNFRCPYCHNPELVDPARYAPAWPEDTVLSELAGRRGLVSGVVITGGEPTLQEDLELFIRKVRSLGFEVKLDTNGSRPEVLGGLLASGLVDHVGLDVKAPPGSFGMVTQTDIDPAVIERSIAVLLASGVEHEIRTTWLPSLLDRSAMLGIAGMVKGCRRWIVQRFTATETLDPAVRESVAPTEAELAEIRAVAETMGISCLTR
jgi:pyruvate formate lyase activating enzyme